MTKYTHPSASPKQPAAESVKATHQIVQEGAPASGVAKLGYKGPGGKPATGVPQSKYTGGQQQQAIDKGSG